MWIRIVYKRAVGEASQEFALEFKDVVMAANHIPQLIERIVGAMTADNSTWVMNVDDDIRRSGEHHEP